MNKRKKRTIWTLSILTVLLLVGGGIAFQRQIREQYWIWKLERCEGEEYFQTLKEIVDHKIYDSVPAIFLQLGREQKPFGRWLISRSEYSEKFPEWKVFIEHNFSLKLEGLNREEDQGWVWNDLIEFGYLVHLVNNNQDLMTKKLKPFLKSESGIQRAVAACLLFTKRDKIEKYVTKDKIEIIYTE